MFSGWRPNDVQHARVPRSNRDAICAVLALAATDGNGTPRYPGAGFSRLPVELLCCTFEFCTWRAGRDYSVPFVPRAIAAGLLDNPNYAAVTSDNDIAVCDRVGVHLLTPEGVKIATIITHDYIVNLAAFQAGGLAVIAARPPNALKGRPMVALVDGHTTTWVDIPRVGEQDGRVLRDVHGVVRVASADGSEVVVFVLEREEEWGSSVLARDGRVFQVDYYGKGIKVDTPDGRSDLLHLDRCSPHSIALDFDQNLVLSDAHESTVYVFTPEGKMVWHSVDLGLQGPPAIQPQPFPDTRKWIMGVSVLWDGTIVVCDSHDERLLLV